MPLSLLREAFFYLLYVELGCSYIIRAKWRCETASFSEWPFNNCLLMRGIEMSRLSTSCFVRNFLRCTEKQKVLLGGYRC